MLQLSGKGEKNASLDDGGSFARALLLKNVWAAHIGNRGLWRWSEWASETAGTGNRCTSCLSRRCDGLGLH
jgi:hypothetical protein